MTTKTMTPKTTLVKCPCPRCYLGYHDQPELADKYRRVGELERENAKLRMLVENAADWLDYMGRSKSAATLRDALN